MVCFFGVSLNAFWFQEVNRDGSFDYCDDASRGQNSFLNLYVLIFVTEAEWISHLK
jgi:hypothetical protein